MKNITYAMNACLKYKEAIDIATKSGIDYGTMIDYITEEDVKQKDLPYWLLEYFREWMETCVEGCQYTKKEAHEEYWKFHNAILEAAELHLEDVPAS